MELEKEEQTTPQISRRKEIIKIRDKISEIDTLKTIEKVKKVGSSKRWKLTNLETVRPRKENSKHLIRNKRENIINGLIEMKKIEMYLFKLALRAVHWISHAKNSS